MANYVSPLIPPHFPACQDGRRQMRLWVSGHMLIAVQRRFLTAADRSTYQQVRKRLNSRDLRMSRQGNEEFRLRHNAATAASRPPPGSAKAEYFKRLNTANKKKHRESK